MDIRRSQVDFAQGAYGTSDIKGYDKARVALWHDCGIQRHHLCCLGDRTCGESLEASVINAIEQSGGDKCFGWHSHFYFGPLVSSKAWDRGESGEPAGPRREPVSSASAASNRQLLSLQGVQMPGHYVALDRTAKRAASNLLGCLYFVCPQSKRASPLSIKTLFSSSVSSAAFSRHAADPALCTRPSVTDLLRDFEPSHMLLLEGSCRLGSSSVRISVVLVRF